jgi:hypothetical protein
MTRSGLLQSSGRETTGLLVRRQCESAGQLRILVVAIAPAINVPVVSAYASVTYQRFASIRAVGPGSLISLMSLKPTVFSHAVYSFSL